VKSTRTAFTTELTVANALAHSRGLILTGNTSDLVAQFDSYGVRLPHLLANLVSREGCATIVYSIAEGAQELVPPNCGAPEVQCPPIGLTPERALNALLIEIRRSEQPILLVLDWCEHLLPSNSTTNAHNRMLETIGGFLNDLQISVRGHRLILIQRVGSMDPRLYAMPGLAEVRIPLPSEAERLWAIERLCSESASPRMRLEPTTSSEEFAAVTHNMRLHDLVQASALSQHHGPIGREWAEATRATNLEHLTHHKLAAPLHNWLEHRELPQFVLIIREARRIGHLPRRLLAAGPPGAATPDLARAVASELGMPMVTVNLSAASAHETLRGILREREAFGSCLLHIDGVGLRGGHTAYAEDGDTDQQHTSANLLWFLDDDRSAGMSILATSSRPDLIAPEILEYFTVVPVLDLVPSEYAWLLRSAADQEARTLDAEVAREVIEAHGQPLTARLLDAVLEQAIIAADLDGLPREIWARHLRTALAEMTAQADTVEQEFLALTAITLTRFGKYLPWRAADALAMTVQLPDYLTPLLDNEGTVLDEAKLRLRLEQLRAAMRGTRTSSPHTIAVLKDASTRPATG
jgi:hypothetical protein